MGIFIYGCGGHGKVVADVVCRMGTHQLLGFVDDTRNEPGVFLGFPVLTSINEVFNKGITAGIIAVGDNSVRSAIAEKIITAIPDFRFVTVVDPSAQIGRGVVIGAGTVVMPGVCVNADSIIGSHCILNTSSSIDHDCQIEEYASIAPGSVLGGNVNIGRYSAIGLGATIIHKISIGSNTVIGAGSVVTKSLTDNIVAYGSPCKVIRSRTLGDRYL